MLSAHSGEHPFISSTMLAITKTSFFARRWHHAASRCAFRHVVAEARDIVLIRPRAVAGLAGITPLPPRADLFALPKPPPRAAKATPTALVGMRL
jgi:hypothetical protein